MTSEEEKVSPSPPKIENVNIRVYALKEKNVVRMEFSEPITWFHLDPVSCATLVQHLLERIKELAQ